MRIPLRLSLILALIPICSAADQSPALKPLFDGRTLTGWAVKGGTATYRVEDGAIVGRTVEASKNTFLCTTRDYADFEFECEVKCDPALNSGIQIRSRTYAKPTAIIGKAQKQREAGEVFGYQCEITFAAKGTSENFWDEARRAVWLDGLVQKSGAATAFKDGAWNHYRIVAQGDRIRSWVNGVPCADFCDALDATGFIGLHPLPVGALRGRPLHLAHVGLPAEQIEGVSCSRLMSGARRRSRPCARTRRAARGRAGRRGC
ncbi:MAG: hypothetical protein RLZZ15_3328 [Verrucomicrobiota bacterium]|jgi:hypothetical protein